MHIIDQQLEFSDLGVSGKCDYHSVSGLKKQKAEIFIRAQWVLGDQVC